MFKNISVKKQYRNVRNKRIKNRKVSFCRLLFKIKNWNTFFCQWPLKHLFKLLRRERKMKTELKIALCGGVNFCYQLKFNYFKSLGKNKFTVFFKIRDRKFSFTFQNCCAFSLPIFLAVTHAKLSQHTKI